MNLVVMIFLGALFKGLTDLLPVSSSGHSFLIECIWGSGAQKWANLNVLFYFSTIIAIVSVYWRVFAHLGVAAVKFIYGLVSGKPSKSCHERLLFMFLTSMIPLMATWLMRDIYTSFRELAGLIEIGVAFIFTAIVMFSAGRHTDGHKSAVNMRYEDALLFGIICALIALLPGVSQLGLSFSVGLLLGFSVRFCIMYSAVMRIPTALGMIVNGFDVVQAQLADARMRGIWILAILLAAVLGAFCLKMLEFIVVRGKFIIFAYYLGALGLLTLGVGVWHWCLL